MMKLRRMRWTGHVTRMGKWELNIKFWSETPKGRDQSEDLGVDGRIIL
jgi:hypothetical protein